MNVIEFSDEENIIKKLMETEKDYEWFIKNKRELRKKYGVNTFIAILDGNVIVSSSNVDEVIRELKEKGQEDAIIEFLEPENATIIY